jgi:hypothetical protein
MTEKRTVTETWQWRDGSPREKRIVEVKCCGSWMQCLNFTNTCDECGADFNFAGQRLASRSQWGEETGEDWWECY